MEFKTDECGKSVGCYREPKGCDAAECEAIVMWEHKGDTVVFQMTGDTDGWVALAFSEDKLMVGIDREPLNRYRKPLTHKQLEMHGCVLSTVATDALALKHQVISTHGAA